MALKANWVDADVSAVQHAAAHNDVAAAVNTLTAGAIGRWRGSWTSGTPADGLGAYAAKDFAVYQGTTYRANTTPTAGEVPQSSLQWDVVAQAGAAGSNGTSGVSFTYQGTWASGTPYLIGQWVTYQGSLYYCNGNIGNLASPPPMDQGWNLGMQGGAAGISPGQTPQVPIRAAGYVYTVGAGSQANGTTLAVNQVAASPIYIPADTSVDRITLYINTAATSALWRLGLFADTGSMYPGALVFEAGTVDASSTGAKEITLASTKAVARGVYWVVAKCEGAFAAPRGTSGPVFGVLPSSNSNTADTSSGYLANVTAAGLPSAWPAWGAAGTGTVGTAPRVGVRVTG